MALKRFKRLVRGSAPREWPGIDLDMYDARGD
jgi:hypothetical protein